MFNSKDKLLEKYHNLPPPAKASFWFLFCMILEKGVSILTTPVFTRLLSPSEYGDFNVYTSWKCIINVFVTMKLAYGVYAQGLVKFEDKRTKFVSGVEGLATLIVCVWFGVYIVFHDWFNSLIGLNTYEMVSMFVTMWSAMIFEFWASEEKVDYRYKALVAVVLCVAIAKPAVGIYVVTHAKEKITARIISLAVIDFIAYSGFFFKQMKKGESLYNNEVWKYAILFQLPLIPHYLSQTVLNNMDRIMIGKMVGDREAGIYSLAYSLSLLVTLINNALMQTMSPWMYTKMRDREVEDIKGIAYIALGVIAVLNLFLIALAPEIIRIFAPKAYFDARWVVPPVAMSVLFMFSYDLFSGFEFYFEKTFFVMIASVIGAGLNVILNFIFIRKYGYIAAGYTTLVCFMLYTLGHYLFMNKICREFLDGVKPYSLKVLMLLYTAFLGMGFLIMMTYDHTGIRYTIIGTFLLVTILMRKRIAGFVEKIISMRKSGKSK